VLESVKQKTDKNRLEQEKKDKFLPSPNKIPLQRFCPWRGLFIGVFSDESWAHALAPHVLGAGRGAIPDTNENSKPDSTIFSFSTDVHCWVFGSNCMQLFFTTNSRMMNFGFEEDPRGKRERLLASLEMMRLSRTPSFTPF